jgi:hypothetical protein
MKVLLKAVLVSAISLAVQNCAAGDDSTQSTGSVQGSGGLFGGLFGKGSSDSDGSAMPDDGQARKGRRGGGKGHPMMKPTCQATVNGATCGGNILPTCDKCGAHPQWPQHHGKGGPEDSDAAGQPADDVSPASEPADEATPS